MWFWHFTFEDLCSEYWLRSRYVVKYKYRQHQADVLGALWLVPAHFPSAPASLLTLFSPPCPPAPAPWEKGNDTLYCVPCPLPHSNVSMFHKFLKSTINSAGLRSAPQHITQLRETFYCYLTKYVNWIQSKCFTHFRKKWMIILLARVNKRNLYQRWSRCSKFAINKIYSCPIAHFA